MRLDEIVFLTETVELFNYKGYSIDASEHACERYEERFPDKPSMDKYFTDIIELFDKHLARFWQLAKDADGNTIPVPPFIVKSKSLNQSVLLAFKPYRKKFTIITFFATGRDHPKTGTERLMIESQDFSLYFEV